MQNECTLGGGDNGYLGIIMPTNEYIIEQTKNGIQIPIGFIKPQPPDPALAADVICRTKSILLNYKSIEAHLKGQIMDTIKRKYIAELDDEKFGFASCSRILGQNMTS